MQEIKRILERRFKGESQRSIASSLHLSRNTVNKIFKAADQTGLSWVHGLVTLNWTVFKRTDTIENQEKR